jgi:hypothetical protein
MAAALITLPRIQNPVENSLIFYWFFFKNKKGGSRL